MGLWAHAAERSRIIEYSDLPAAIRAQFIAAGIGEWDFRGYVAGVERETDQRVAEGDREHVVYFALQSRTFTDRPRIEPALSAKRFVERLPAGQREQWLRNTEYAAVGWPPAERARMADLLRVLQRPAKDARLAYVREIVAASNVAAPDAWLPDYVRVARFLYLKEFASGQDGRAIAGLYQSRPHSVDTQVDAGFGVYTGLAVVRALDPSLRIRRALIVGPGLDLAPRTDLRDDSDPQSYQPLAVADALLTLSLSSEDDLRIHSVDVNPRVVRAVQALARDGVTWRVFPGLPETSEQPFSPDYQSYLHRLGRAIGVDVKAPASGETDRRSRRAIAVRAPVARALGAEPLNVITRRFVDEPPFDLVVATNVLPYFDDRQLALALSNIAAMLRPGGYLLHNESRPGLPETTAALGLPAVQMRTAMLGGSKARPLYDVVWIHQKSPGVRDDQPSVRDN